MGFKHASMEHPFLNEWRSGASVLNARTSGSTGAPKNIQLLRTDMLVSARATCRFFGIEKNDRIHCPLSLDYIAGKMMVVRAEVSGAALTLETPTNSPLGNDTDPRPIKLLPVVPSQIMALNGTLRPGAVENIIVGGAPMDASTEQTARKLPARIWATYGMTETCSHVALRDVSAGGRHFTALPGFTFSTDNRGCLVIEHDVMSFRRLVTNDVVQLLSPSGFIWLSRFDNVINSGGIKLFPEQLERLIAPHMGNIPFYITSRPSAVWGEEAVMVTEQGAVQNPPALLRKLHDALPHRHCPKAIIEQPFTYTHTGKLIRKRLPS